MFVFAAVQLFKMQSRVRTGQRQSGIRRQSYCRPSNSNSGLAAEESSAAAVGAAAASSGGESEDGGEAGESRRLRERFIRQVSTVSSKIVKNTITQAMSQSALKERYSIELPFHYFLLHDFMKRRSSGLEAVKL